MFIHVYFVLLSKYEKTIGSCAAWTKELQRSDTTLKSHKTLFIVWISYKMTKFESWDFVSYQK